MSITLVGVFDSDTEAEMACRRLESAGFDRRAIRATSTSSGAETQDDDHRGFFAKLFGIGDDDDSSNNYSEAVQRGNSVVTVELDDDSRADEVSVILEDAGAIDIDERVAQWEETGYVPSATGGSIADREGQQTLQSVEERLKVGKRAVQKGRVRVHRTTTETPVEERVTLRDEKASIERHKVDRPATDADLRTAFKDQDIEISESSEEPVVQKTARVVEEVTVGKKSAARTETVKDRLRSTRIDIENMTDSPGTSRMYSGPERRRGGSNRYQGVERRANP